MWLRPWSSTLPAVDCELHWRENTILCGTPVLQATVSDLQYWGLPVRQPGSKHPGKQACLDAYWLLTCLHHVTLHIGGGSHRSQETCNLCLKSRSASRTTWPCSNKLLSCLFKGNMTHELHKPVNIYRASEPFPEDAPTVQGYDFNRGVDHKALLQSFFNTGFQATHFGRAVREINRMVRPLKPPCEHISSELKKKKKNASLAPCRHPQIEKRKQPWNATAEGDGEEHPPHCPCRSSCTIFLGYTSNMISSGVRESIRYLVQHRMVRADCQEWWNSTLNEKNAQNRVVLKYFLSCSAFICRSMSWWPQLGGSRRIWSSVWAQFIWETSTCLAGIFL